MAFVTSVDERRQLLAIARDAIAAAIGGAPAPAPPLTGVLARAAGAFVTVHNHGDLRGCIGHVEADQPLGRLIPRMAVAAATADPRFRGVDARELPQIDLEISVLGPLETIDGPADIEIGRHGLVVERGACRGLLLPQVAPEWKWDPATFLAHTCQKAGLPPDAWRSGARLFRFEAEVFGERQHERGF